MTVITKRSGCSPFNMLYLIQRKRFCIISVKKWNEQQKYLKTVTFYVLVKTSKGFSFYPEKVWKKKKWKWKWKHSIKYRDHKHCEKCKADDIVFNGIKYKKDVEKYHNIVKIVTKHMKIVNKTLNIWRYKKETLYFWMWKLWRKDSNITKIS